ncbi:DUF6158 family protein [Dactylosporangium sp. CA-233914]|uniref:DUF6158 family protein n=1 Tax=Dactylosporangium sp. CA-233914 TaxID=3239934 RepID=UPI003D8ADA9C
MDEVSRLLDAAYAGRERLTRDEIYRHAVATDAPAEAVAALDALPEGEYAHDEAIDALAELGRPVPEAMGIPAAELSDEDLSRELGHLHETRDDTFRHGPPQALVHHDERTAELEAEYLRRFPDRDIEPRRLRPPG